MAENKAKHEEILSHYYALAGLGYAEHKLGQDNRAVQHLGQALSLVTKTSAMAAHSLSLHALLAIALLLVDRGEVERAVELYALACRYPFVANSRWYEDVAGKHITAAAATMPPEFVAAAQERGRARNLETTMKELLAELEQNTEAHE